MTQNWAGTYAYTAPRLVEATSIDDVRRLLAEPGRVHALGTRHSFTDIPDTTGTLIDVTGLPSVFELDEEAATVTVAAGTRYGVLALRLHERGWALPNMGSLPHINVAGATATGTHGSGDANPVMSASVQAVSYVGADAELHEVHRGAPDFDALVIGLGAFGIVTSVTLDVVPAFEVRQDIYQGLTWPAFLENIDAVTGAAYSVSVFTRWVGDEVGDLLVKRRTDTEPDVAPTLLDARCRTSGDSSFDEVLGDNRTPVGEPGPWMLRLPHFRLDATPSMGEEIQTEYFVPRAHAAAALAAVRSLADQLEPHLAVTEVRTAARDELWLSPAYERDSFIIHFTWFDHPEPVAALVPQIEASLAPFDARPHWGKQHAFDRAAIERVHPRLADTRAVFERLDPDGRFVNDHLVRIGAREPRVI